MATKEQKNSKIAEIKEAFDKAQVALLSDPTALTVFEITKLRRELQKEGADLKVVKNTLAIKAIEGTQYECLKDMFKGPVAVAFGFNDQVSPAKILTKFAKEFEKAEVKGGALDGKALSKQDRTAQEPGIQASHYRYHRRFRSVLADRHARHVAAQRKDPLSRQRLYHCGHRVRRLAFDL